MRDHLLFEAIIELGILLVLMFIAGFLVGRAI